MTTEKGEFVIMRGEYSRGKRCIWTNKEDEVLLSMASEKGVIDWAKIADTLNSLKEPHSLYRTPKQCRERWHNRVNPSIKTSPWTEEEVNKFFELFQKQGPKWSHIASELNGRTDNTVKNFFYCKLRKIARRIKKSIITEEMKSTGKEVEYNLFLIKYLQSYFLGDKAYPINDKYILEMAKSSSITSERINTYLKSYKASIKANSSHDTEDSKSNMSLLPNSNVLLEQKKEKDKDRPKKSKIYSDSDIKFFAQLLFMENGLTLDTDSIKLPIPTLPTKIAPKDDCQPAFNFIKGQLIDKSLSNN
jgi:hypothetical protein